MKTKKTQKKTSAKKPKPKAEYQPPPFKFVVYADLHVRDDTVDRAIATLGFVRELARDQGADGVICLGDFWDLRGVIRVRQLDAVQREFARWYETPHILIPGNHDQVDRSGQIHGLKIFDRPEWNWTVHTEAHVEGPFAFLPWREDPEIQRELFANLPPHVTVFGHAEAPGSVANNGHKMEGKFDQPGVRAVYLGHFHKRQKIGQNLWYIGDPFEQNIGERDEPHGVAVVTHEQIEPTWFEVPGMPKHFVFHWPEDNDRFSEPAEQDIVEVWASAADLDTDEFEAALEQFETDDVRTLPKPEEATDEAPAPALTVDEAIDQYVSANPHESLGTEELQRGGKELLALVEHERARPLASVVRPKWVEAEGFCKIPGKVRLDLENQGMVLLRGAMGSGKTALLDALSWCYFENTSPRQDASASSGFKGDEVVNDHGETCTVESCIEAGSHEYVVRRTRRRGKSSKLEIERDGQEWDTGVVDHGDQLRRLVGLDYELWRAAVYLGQGSVANFVTDTNKHRLALLSHVAGVEVCTKVLKKLRTELKDVERKVHKREISLSSVRSRADTLRGLSYEAETQAWEARRTAALAQHNARIEELKTEIERIDQGLASETQWKDQEAKLRTRIEELRAQRNQAEPSQQIIEYNQALGQAQAERASTAQALDQLTKSRDQAHNTGTCSQCGQALPAEDLESKLEQYEIDLSNKRAQIETLDNRIRQLQTELGQLKSDPVRIQMIDSQIRDLEPRLTEATQALATLDRIRDKRQTVAAEWNRILADIETKRAEENPFRAKAAEHAQELAGLEDQIGTEEQEISGLKARQALLEYWDQGFGRKGIPSMVMYSIAHDLEIRANYYLARLTDSTISVEVQPEDGGLDLVFWEREGDELWERSFKQLSGGQRRCVQISFSPFAISDLIFNRLGVRIPISMIDELTTHMDAPTKSRVCDILSKLGRETVLVADHDIEVQGVFDNVIDLVQGEVAA